MRYCKNCGDEVQNGSSFCAKCGSRVEAQAGPVLATWGERVIAYIIYTMLLGLVLVWFSLPGLRLIPLVIGGDMLNLIPFVYFSFRNIIYLAYWFLMEQTYGQSLGKVFLLPLDLILGWVMYPSTQQRLFDNLSKTVVLKKQG